MQHSNRTRPRDSGTTQFQYESSSSLAPLHHPNRYIMTLMQAPTLSKDAPIGVVFDGDDTLWRTEQLYDDARSEARRIVSSAGLDGSEWEALERRLDVDNVATIGYSTRRFPASCVQAYEEISRRANRLPDPIFAERVHSAASSVFERDAEVVEGARQTLSELRENGMRLALLTKGDYDLQRRRIKRSGLCHLFDTIEIVPEKSPDTIRSVVASLGVDVNAAWMVGNSIRSDILPAIDAGLRAIWVDAHVWEYERAQDHLVDDRVTVASHLAQVPKLIVP